MWCKNANLITRRGRTLAVEAHGAVGKLSAPLCDADLAAQVCLAARAELALYVHAKIRL